MTMEATGRKIDQVHVLKQTFRPNEPFRAALAKLVVNRPGETRPFSIFGSDERMVGMNIATTHEFDVQLTEANRYMATQQNIHMNLESGMSARLLRLSSVSVVLQLIMQPASKKELIHISKGLDVVEFGERKKAMGLQALQLYTSIPFSQLAPIPIVKDRIAEMNEVLASESSRTLYQVTPLPYLVGQISTRLVSPAQNPDQPEI